MNQQSDMFFSDWDLETIVNSINPTREDEVSQIFYLLQSGDLDDAMNWLRIETSRYPWVMLAAAHLSLRKNFTEEAKRWLRAVTLVSSEAILQLWAWYNLQKLGVKPSEDLAQKILGIVIEVPNEGSVDTLATYADGTARFLSHSGALIHLEEYHATITPLIHEGLKLARSIGKLSDAHRGDPLPEGEVRLSVLTPGGISVWKGIPEEGSEVYRLFARQAVLLRNLVQFAINNKPN